jgi:hypothetical protein
LGRIETMYQRLASRLQALMQSLTFDSQVPAIDLGSIIDSMAWSSEFRRSEYSFITYIKNRERTDIR